MFIASDATDTTNITKSNFIRLPGKYWGGVTMPEPY